MPIDKYSYLNLDVRALQTFLIIMETGSITATANQLNVTQSAVSHGLDKLRGIFKDELFLRAGRGIKPTPRAEQLFEELKPLLANIKALTQTTDFDPASASISWTIAANDFQRDVILPAFYQKVASQVKHFSLKVVPSEVPTVELLRASSVDIAISPVAPDASDILQKRLFSSYASCFFDDKCRSAPVTLEDFQKASYISLNFLEGKHYIDIERPVTLPIEENIRIRVSNFAGLANFLRQSDLLVIAPELMKNNILAEFKVTPLPYTPQSINMFMLWHQRYSSDATHQWLRKQLSDIPI